MAINDLVIPDVGDFILTHNGDCEHLKDYFGVVLEKYTRPCYQCLENENKKEKGLKKLKKLWKEKQKEIPEYECFITKGFYLQVYDAFGIQIPKAGSSFDNKIEHRIVWCVNELKEKKFRIYIGKEEILAGFQENNLDIFIPYIKEIINRGY